MKNVTVSMESELYTAARIKAARKGVSLSGLVRELLAGHGDEEHEPRAAPGMSKTEFDRRTRDEERLRELVRGFDGGHRAAALFEPKRGGR